MKKTKAYILLVVLAVLSVACSDDIYDSSKVASTKLELTTEWNDRGTDISIPTAYTVALKSEKFDVEKEKNTFDEVTTGNTHLIIFNTPIGMEVENNVVAVKLVDNYITPMPDWLFTSMNNITLYPSTTNKYVGRMKQDLREVNFEVKTNSTEISSMGLEAAGIASKLDIQFNRLSDKGTVKVELAKENEVYKGTIRVLGLVDDALGLTLKLAYANGTEELVETKIEKWSVNFNNNKSTPLTISTKVSTSIDGINIKGSVGEWEINKGGVIIN